MYSLGIVYLIHILYVISGDYNRYIISPNLLYIKEPIFIMSQNCSSLEDPFIIKRENFKYNPIINYPKKGTYSSEMYVYIFWDRLISII